MTDANDSGDDDSSQSEDASDESSDDEKSAREIVAEQKRELSPDVGYRLVEWDMLKPPTERLVPRTRRTLKLSEMSIPTTTEFQDWSVFDRHTNDYVDRTFPELPDDPTPESLPDALEIITGDDTKARRIELMRIARLASTDPEACRTAVPTLADVLPEADPAEQAEIVGIFDTIADEYPEVGVEDVDVLLPLLIPDTHEELLKDILSLVKTLVEYDPQLGVDAAPKLAVLLDEDVPNNKVTLGTLVAIARTHPDAVVPLAPELIDAVEGGDGTERLLALAGLGHLAKHYPYVAEQAIPLAIELLDTPQEKLRANAAGLLADFADEYPTQVRPAVPRSIELLNDTDEIARYNATSILSRVANEHPAAVKDAIDPLVDVLEANRTATRLNACYALGYIGPPANQAVNALRDAAEGDPDEEVQEIAGWACERIIGDDG